MELATVADVEARLGRSLTEAEASRTDPGLLEEASVKALAHMGLGDTYYDTVAVPLGVTIVVSRMVARVLQQSDGGAPPAGATTAQESVGPFSRSFGFMPGSTSGGPWLTKSDKADLDNASGANKAHAIDTVPTGDNHAETCAYVFGAGWCSCGASIAGVPIFGV